ncbi:MAG: Papain family cysteine protease [Methanomassiliicoccales archaeon PtaU1.Bin124]|nr:MAG: Papain family cysteine protease [Methanomassiliicoccales archaeon PtaU1.Bin124]
MGERDIDRIRRKVEAQKLGWKVRPSPFSNLSKEEIRRRYGSPLSESMRLLYLDFHQRTQAYIQTVMPSTPIFTDRDWRDVEGKSYVTPSKKMGDIGACTAFALAATLESNLAIRKRQSVDDLTQDLSETDLYFCPSNPNCDPDQGMFIEDAFRKVNERGISMEQMARPWPTDPQNIKCMDPSSCTSCGNDSNRATCERIVAWTTIDDIGKAKEWIYRWGPVIAEMVVLTDFVYYDPTGGPYIPTAGEDFVCLHTLSVIGFVNTPNEPAYSGYWICKDTKDVFIEGIVKIAYGQCGMLSKYVHPVDGTEFVFPFYGLGHRFKFPQDNPMAQWEFPHRRWPENWDELLMQPNK